MPPDSLTLRLVDSFLRRDTVAKIITELPVPGIRTEVNEGAVSFGVLFIFTSLLAVLAVNVWLPERAERKRRQQRIAKAGALVSAKGVQYHEWLYQFNPFYAALDKRDQQRFLERTIAFMQSKQFVYHSIPEEEYIPVLISGAATQLTFGLNNFLMDYFSVIHITRNEYYMEHDGGLYLGHVSRSGICVSWNYFLGGYEDYTDCYNLGLHEMAHAISYDAFLGQQDAHDWEFKQRLQQFSSEGTLIYRAMQGGRETLLDDYATTNFDEFWAVCIETFFENPQEFSEEMPLLYGAILKTLNQDPRVPGKIIKPGLAGLV